MEGGGRFLAKFPLNWKKSFCQGVVIPHKKKNCSACKKDILCENGDNLVNQKKKTSAILNELKRQLPNDFGHKLNRYEN